jgi:hypothetical protein
MIGSMIGSMIAPLIGQPDQEIAADGASESAKTDVLSSSNRSHGLYRNQEQKEIPPPTPQPARAGGGGKAHQLIDTESAQTLRSINILPAQVAELADLPLNLIRAAIHDGQARPSVRDLAGWVVHLLRNARDHEWSIQPPSPHADSPEALRAAFARYAEAQASEQVPAPAASDQAGCSVAADGTASADAAAIDLPQERSTLAPSDDQAHAAPASLDSLPLWEQVLTALQAQVGRQAYQAYLQRTRLLAIADGVATIAAPDAQVKETLENHYLGQLRELLGTYAGGVAQVRIVVRAPVCAAGAADAPHVGGQSPQVLRPAARSDAAAAADLRPMWIPPACWQQLSRVLRALLLGSTLEAGAVQCKTPYLTALVRTRYAAEVALLVSSVDELIEPSIISFITPGASLVRNDYAPAITAS